MKCILKRVLALVLCAAMVVGSDSIQAFGAELNDVSSGEYYSEDVSGGEAVITEEETVDPEETIISEEETIIPEEETLPEEPETEEVLTEEESETEDIYDVSDNDILTEEFDEDMPTSGKCGDDITWSLNTETGVLTLTGSGKMYDYNRNGSGETAPWYSYFRIVKKVLISEKIENIGNAALAGLINLTDIEFPKNSLTEIGVYAFYQDISLEVLEVPNSVKTIDDYGLAFTCFSSIEIPEGVETLGDYALFCNDSLECVTLPSSLKSVGACIFLEGNCKSLDKVIYNGTVEDWSEVSVGEENEILISKLVYAGPAEEVKIVAQGTCGKNAKWKVESDGVLTIYGKGAMTNYTESKKAPWAKYLYDYDFTYECYIKKIVIEEGITSVGNYAFNQGFGVESIMLPDTLKSLGEGSFYYCWNVKTITIPASITTIPKNCFRECCALETIVTKSSITQVGDYAFYNCNSCTFDMDLVFLSKIGQYAFAKSGIKRFSTSAVCAIKSIGKGAFSESDLEELYLTRNDFTTIPESMCEKCVNLQYVDMLYVKTVGEMAFNGCKSLSYLNYGKLETISNCAFYGCESLVSFSIPKTLTVIADGAFCGSGIVTADIPDTVTVLGQYAYADCFNLETAIIPGSITKIATGLFHDCEKLKDIEIGFGVKSIGDYAFSGSDAIMEHIILPGSVTTIGEEAFSYNSIKAIYIPSSVTKIGLNAFLETDIDSVIYPGTEKQWFNIKIAQGNECLTGTGAYISFNNDCMFEGELNENISVALSFDGILTITGSGEMPDFSGENGLLAQNNYIRKVFVEEGITYIGNGTFAYDYNLESVTLPKSLVSIGNNAFYGCGKLTNIALPDGIESIGMHAFTDCISLEKINLPEGITYIGGYAFYGAGLKTISWPASCKEMLNDTFWECNRLESIYLPEDIAIDDCAIEDCPNLKDVYYDGDLGQWLTLERGALSDWSIDNGLHCNSNIITGQCGADAYFTIDGSELTISGSGDIDLVGGTYGPWLDFINVGNITSVVIEEGITCIPDRAFYGHNCLSKVTLPSTLVRIGDYAFSNCTCLAEINIPEGVTELGNWAFEFCENIHYLRLPEGLKVIGSKCFDFAQSLRAIILPNTLESIGSDALDHTNSIAYFTGTEEEFKKISGYENVPQNKIRYGCNVFYTVKYVDNMGVQEEYEYHYVGESFNLVSSISKRGYILNGWKIGKTVYKPGDLVSDLTNKNGEEVVAVAQLTVDPNLTNRKYTVKFDSNGGKGTMKSVTMEVGKAKALPANTFSMTGYHFAGWSINPEWDVRYKNKESVIDLNHVGNIYGSEVVLYAKWEPNNYTITFNGNGGKLSDGKTTVKEAATCYSNVALERNSFSRPGYTFAGWSTSKKAKKAQYLDCDLVYNLTTKNNGKVTLYAVWKANSYTIKFMGTNDDPNGIDSRGITEIMVVPFGKSVKLNSVKTERNGYYFTGWKCSNGKTYKNGATVKNLTNICDGIVTMTPIWAENTYTVKYNVNGATCKAPAAVKVKGIADALVMPKPEFAGYVLVGWNTKANGTGDMYMPELSYKFSANVVKNKGTITLYAIWKYEVRINPGTAGGEEKNIIFTYKADNKIDSSVFTKTGYKIIGWNTDADKAARGVVLKSVKSIAPGTTLYAAWKPITYTIKFINGSKSKTQKMTYDVEAVLNKNTFTKKGYTFDYWYRWGGGGRHDYSDGEAVINLTDVDGEVIIFDSIFKIVNYDITYVLPEGAENAVGNPEYYSIVMTGSTYTDFVINAPTMEGYTFKGWYKDSKFKTKFTKLSKDQTGNMTLYAKFVKNK